jgi:hypothetical protein
MYGTFARSIATRQSHWDDTVKLSRKVERDSLVRLRNAGGQMLIAFMCICELDCVSRRSAAISSDEYREAICVFVDRDRHSDQVGSRMLRGASYFPPLFITIAPYVWSMGIISTLSMFTRSG